MHSFRFEATLSHTRRICQLDSPLVPSEVKGLQDELEAMRAALQEEVTESARAYIFYYSV